MTIILSLIFTFSDWGRKCIHYFLCGNKAFRYWFGARVNAEQKHAVKARLMTQSMGFQIETFCGKLELLSVIISLILAKVKARSNHSI